MDLLERLINDMKSAMKSGNRERLGVLRMLISDVRNIDLAPKPITAEETVAAYGKKLRKSQEEYLKLGKTEQAEQLRAEMAIVDEYLPKKASPEQTEQWVDSFLAEHQFTAKQLGQAMGLFMKAHGTNVDPGVVNSLIRKKLQ